MGAQRIFGDEVAGLSVDCFDSAHRDRLVAVNWHMQTLRFVVDDAAECMMAAPCPHNLESETMKDFHDFFARQSTQSGHDLSAGS
jgi:hypothetical protein